MVVELKNTLAGINTARAVLLAAFALVIFCIGAEASSWNSTRDRAMALRERGGYQQAYQLVNNHTASGANLFDKEFVAGWIALRNLKRADIALAHFRNMAMASKHLRGERSSGGKAKAGYWMGRALTSLNRKKDAEIMYRAAFAYPNTFYGQLAASELNISVKHSHVKHLASEYPIKSIYWHDPRIRKEYVLATIREESRFRQNAESNRAAKGMMQVLDGTALYVGKKANVSIDTRLMKNNADYNIAVGSRYLADQMAEFNGNTMLASSAYNAGPARPVEWLSRFGDPRGGGVDAVDWAESIPFRETREYVQKVIASYVTYVALLNP